MYKTLSVNIKQVAYLDLFFRAVYFIFIASFIFSLRAFSSISLGLLFVSCLLFLKNKNHVFPIQKGVLLFVTSCATFFLFNFLHLLINGTGPKAWSNILLTSGVIVLPITVILSRSFIFHNTIFFLKSIYLLLLLACTYCLAMAVLWFSKTGETDVFFYHSLLKPLHYHAVYFSIILFTALVCLTENYPVVIFQGKYPLRVALILFFTVFLILLSSKLVIGFYFGFIGVVFIRNLVARKPYKKLLMVLIILLISILVVLFSTPVKKRFRDITSGSLSIIKQDTFNRGVYFNGLQFRLLQWKFVPQILQKKDKWVSGVGADQSQQLLDSEYIRRKMYIGDPARKDTGLLNYNTHNQFLQSLLENGIPGAITFLLLIASLAWMTFQKKIFAFTVIILLITIYSFVESLLKTQYGILVFTFLPLLFYSLKKERV